MKITGIDKEKCIECGLCAQACPAMLFEEKVNAGKKGIVFSDKYDFCIGCYHCSAICPKDALLDDEGAVVAETPSGSESISYDSLIGLLKTKRSDRIYKDREIPKEELEKIIEAMRYSPTARNAQSMKFYVIRDKEKLDRLRTESLKFMAKMKGMVKIRKFLKPFIPKAMYEMLNKPGLEEGMKEMQERIENSGKDVVFFDAPAIIMITAPKMGEMAYLDVSSAATYGMLAAEAMGIGSCWIGYAIVTLLKNAKLRQYLDIPGDMIPAGVITLGYPEVKCTKIPKRKEADVVWW